MANMLSTAPVQPQPLAPLPAALDSLSGAISRLADAASSVRIQVQPVLAPSAPMAGDTKAAGIQGIAPSPQSEMVESVFAERRRIDEITAMLHDVLQRLEV